MLAAVAAAGLCAVPATSSAADRAFAPRYQTHTRGNIAMAANTLLSCPEGAANCAGARAGTGSSANLANNGWAMANVDVDPDATTFNSSSADLSVPAGATVSFAGLYWGADTSAGSGGAAAPAPAFANSVLLKAPGAGAYAPVTGALDTSTTWPTRFQGFADVTAQVAAAGAGSYTVANLQAGTGNDRYGGWTLVVAYRSSAQPVRDLSVYDGLATVATGSPQTIALNGIEAPPSGTVQGSLGIVSWESELGLAPDSATLNGTAVSDAVHPATNFFNSSIAAGGSLVTTKSPDYANQLGFDAGLVGINGLIPAGSTSASLQLSTSSDTYFAGVVTLATDRPAEPPSNDTLPALSGTALDGQTLSAGDGAWSGTEDFTYAYQWQRCDASGDNCQDIPGATDSTYTLTPADAGHTVRVVVTATNTEGSAPATSDASAVVESIPPSSTLPPAIGGNAGDGQTLTAGGGSWSGTGPFSETYQWQRCDQAGENCVDIPGATGPSYGVGSDDVGHTIVVIVTDSNGAGSDSAVSPPTPVVTAKPPGPPNDDQITGGGSTPPTGAKPDAGTKPGSSSADLDIASLGWSRLVDQGCRRSSGARVLVFHVAGAGRFRIRVAPNGTLSDRRPLTARALVSAAGARVLQRNLRHVVYSLGGRRLSTRGRAPYKLRVAPSLLARATHQTLVVRVVPKRGKVRVAKLALSTKACPDLFSVIHRPSPRGSLLGLRVDTRKSLNGVTFRMPAGLLAARSARQGWAGAIRIGVSGQKPMNWRLSFPERPFVRMILLAGPGAPTVTVSRGKVTVSGLPDSTGIVQLKLRGRPMLKTPRALLRAVLKTGDGASRRLTQRFGSRLR